MSLRLSMTGLCSLILAASMISLSASAGTGAVTSERSLYQSVGEWSPRFEIVSTSVGHNVTDVFELDFSNGFMMLTYFGNNETHDSYTDWQLFLELSQLIEFKDDGNGYYDGNDVITSETDLQFTVWNSTYTDYEHSLALGLTRSTILTANEQAPISLEFIATENGADLHGFNLRSTEIMMNLTVRSHEWSDGADHIAVGIDMNSRRGLNPEVTYNVAWNNTTPFGAEVDISYPPIGYYRWGTSCSVDGAFGYANSTWWNGRLFLSYPKGTNISHTQILGVESLAETSGTPVEPEVVKGDLPIFAIGLVLAASVATGAILLSTRIGKKT